MYVDYQDDVLGWGGWWVPSCILIKYPQNGDLDLECLFFFKKRRKFLYNFHYQINQVEVVKYFSVIAHSTFKDIKFMLKFIFSNLLKLKNQQNVKFAIEVSPTFLLIYSDTYAN